MTTKISADNLKADIAITTTGDIDVSSGTLTLANDQISGDKISGGTISTFASTGIDDNATSTAITIDSSERVGIGTSSLVGTFNIETSNNNHIYLKGTTGEAYGLWVADDGNRLNIGSWTGHETIRFDSTNQNIQFRTATGAERMRIDSSGRVGIGTSSPGQKLHVVDGAIQVESTSATGNAWFYAKNVDRTWLMGCRGSSSDALSFYDLTTDAERMRIDSSGNVGIGITNPNANLNIVQASNTQKLLRLRNNTADTSNGDGFTIEISDSSSPVCTLDIVSGGDDATLAFSTNRTERMRIESNGHVGLGKTVSDANTVAGIKFFKTGQQYLYTAPTTNIMRFYNSSAGTLVGNINITASATAYNTSSDYRLKENVSYDFDATTRLKQLKPARFNFIADADTTVDGFLAHEVSSVVPEAITGTKDAVQVWEEGDELPEGVSVGDNKLDENGNTIPVYQGIDQAKLVPLLVKTIQELEARITALETNQP